MQLSAITSTARAPSILNFVMASSSPAEAYANARKLIDDAHGDDPLKLELTYADNVEHFTHILLKPDTPTSAQLLAARCQHIRRFDVQRSSYPDGKAGYLKWRRDLYIIQADLAVNLCSSAGISAAECIEIHDAVAKKDLMNAKCHPTTALLEDAAVLTFLAEELKGFADAHGDWTEEKWIKIIQKTWKKTTERGKVEATKLLGDMDEGLVGLITKALEEEGPKA